MGVFRFAAAGALALAVSLTASAAFASSMDIDCVWPQLPDNVRDGLLAAAPDADTMTKAAVSDPAALQRVADACNISLEGDNAKRFGESLAAKTLEVWSMDELGKRNVTGNDLQKAWDTLTPSQRTTISDAMMAGKTTDQISQELARLATDLGIKDSDGVEKVAYYIAARAMVEGLAQ